MRKLLFLLIAGFVLAGCQANPGSESIERRARDTSPSEPTTETVKINNKDVMLSGSDMGGNVADEEAEIKGMVSEGNDIEPDIDFPEIDFEIETDEGDGENDLWMGTWTRTAVYTDGELVTTEPATLTLNKTTYSSSTAACTTSGSLEAGDGTITLIMTQDGCPDNLPLPFTVTYSYTIEENEDGDEIMTTVTGPVMETYVR